MQTIDGKSPKPFKAQFVDEGSGVRLELRNDSDERLMSVEVLTVFLKDETTPGGGPSQANIKFKDTECIYPKETVVISHLTWINGKKVGPAHDLLARLTEVAGVVKPYVLDIAWLDTAGKSGFQRIPVGH